MQIYIVGAFKMKAEIISCGTELLLGEVIDTNASYLAAELAKIGVSVYHHTTVGDNPKRLLDSIQHAENRANLVILSGGLGPTQDDITKDILADHLDLALVVDEFSLGKIKARSNTQKVSLANRHQSLVIESAVVLKNDIGMAVGMFVEKNGQDYALLPGPPNEFEHMVSEYLIPLLVKRSGKKKRLESRNLNFYGLPESVVSERLEDLIENQTNPTIAVYAKEGIIDIRLTVGGINTEKNKQLLDEVEFKIMNRIGKYFVSYSKKTIHDLIREYLNSKNQKIATIEINTNSDLQATLTEKKMIKNPLKASWYFPNITEAQNYLKLEVEKKNKKSFIEQNEELAFTIKDKLKTDYVLAVTSLGEVKKQGVLIPQELYMTIVNSKGEKLSKKVDFNKRMYLADWVIKLKISDFIRRYLLSFDQLED